MQGCCPCLCESQQARKQAAWSLLTSFPSAFGRLLVLQKGLHFASWDRPVDLHINRRNMYGYRL